ncbi:MAG: amidase [Solimonas sp.]
MRVDEYAGHDALGLRELLRRREVSAAELRACALEAIAQTNPQLNFMAGAPFAADAAAPDDAAMAGVPMLLKEGHGAVGGALAMGSRLAAGLKAPADSEFTRRLRAGGLQLLGETTAPEFGIYPVTESGLHGATRNPWNLDHSPGGSSGGASAAVAAGVVPVAQTSDGGGSIRGPAHCTGLFGLKPSVGRTPLLRRALFDFVCVHVTSRTVRDSAAFLDLLHGHHAGAASVLQAPERPYLEEVGRAPGRLRIGVLRRSPGHTKLDAECALAVERAALLAESLGHHVEDAQPAIGWDELIARFLSAWTHALPTGVRKLAALSGRVPGPDTLDAVTWKFHEQAQHVSVDELLAADACFQAARIAVDDYFTRYDLWLTPAGVSQAPAIGRFDPRRGDESADAYAQRALHDYAILTPLLNITGHPAASLPLHHGANGLPAGVQVVGPMGGEASILRIAAQFEAQVPWIARRPPHSVFTSATGAVEHAA